jgi:hypothetical protein
MIAHDGTKDIVEGMIWLSCLLEDKNMSICTPKTKIDGHRLFYNCKNYHVFSTKKCTLLNF